MVFAICFHGNKCACTKMPYPLFLNKMSLIYIRLAQQQGKLRNSKTQEITKN